MAQATIHHITPAQRVERDTVFAAGFRSLESPVCEAHHMAELAEGDITDLLQEIAKKHPISNDRAERAAFAIIHLTDMIRALKAEYYGVWENRIPHGPGI